MINLNAFQDAKQALSDLTMAINIDRKFAEAFSWRAEISAVDFGDFREAKRDISQALEILPNDPLVNFHAAIVYIKIAEKNLDMKKLDKDYEFFKHRRGKRSKEITTKTTKRKSFFKITKLYHGFKPNHNKFFWK